MFNPWQHTIRVTDPTKTGLVKKVIEKEKRGWECIKPLHKVGVRKGSYVDRYKQTHRFDMVEFAVIMRRRSVIEC
ncbi:hypothetical protein PQE66_gp182 [Bacillus phage PBC2]|uniref:Uncharacterized protein n=1 Tax=Bacillus phage PBC2 TaxID=1675029 RepID=A0A218KC77_9CAUD|nr:hypothetical protein PQE66_gp182 [Bacillus phage PBC2]AKQ08497.1 hypothetical protein PBC2_182 [Bacillus phage PBC2]